MAKMASLHAAENEEPNVPRETNHTPYTAGFHAGQEWERQNQRKNQMDDLQELVESAKEVGALTEQLRILKLLQDDLRAQETYYHFDGENPCGMGCECHTHKVKDLIALIKGENK
jgi:hypothetical protein